MNSDVISVIRQKELFFLEDNELEYLSRQKKYRNK